MNTEIPPIETKDQNQPTKKRRNLYFNFWGPICLLFILSFLIWLFFLKYQAYTDDAYVEGNQVFITPLKSGFITAIHTDDTYFVKKGQLLIELDTTDSEIALDAAKEELANIVREVCQAFHQVFTLMAEQEAKKAELIRAAQDFKHRQDVLWALGVSIEDYQHAVANLKANYHALKAINSNFKKSVAYVQGTGIKTHPRVLFASTQLRNMHVQHYRCKIYAPVDGLVAQRKIQVGMWVNAGQPIFSVIPLDQIWVNANFKETQMKEMKIGQKVKLTSDLYGYDIIYHGVVEGLPGAAGNAFSLLPPQNLSGNWIKIVQRLPVRIGLNHQEIKDHPLRIGLSMHAFVDLHDQEGELVPTSSAGSPLYTTSIFKEEEKGVFDLIEKVIESNLDPTLLAWSKLPLTLSSLNLNPNRLDIESDIKEALLLIGLNIEELNKFN